MPIKSSVQFPSESDAYRQARNELLQAEIELRRHAEQVAALRRHLPPGGVVPEDYVFEEGAADLNDTQTVRQVSFSELFAPCKNTLIAYNFMYSAQMERPCPFCTSMLDALHGNARHAAERVNLVVIAKSPIARIREFARERGWLNYRLLSSANNNYNRDYLGEMPDGGQMPSLNVFVKDGDQVRHWYNTEMLFAPSDAGQHPRHVDLLWPLWNLLDLTPEGRGTDWTPRLEEPLVQLGKAG